MTDSATSKIQQELRRAMGELETLADEIRVKVHLGGMDAKDAWSRVEPQLKDLEGRVSSASETMVGELRTSARDLKAELRSLAGQLGLTRD